MRHATFHRSRMRQMQLVEMRLNMQLLLEQPHFSIDFCVQLSQWVPRCAQEIEPY